MQGLYKDCKRFCQCLKANRLAVLARGLRVEQGGWQRTAGLKVAGMERVSYRLATEADLSGVHATFTAAVIDLDRRRGRTTADRPQHHYDWQRRYLLREDGPGWWLAVDERDRVLGWAAAVLRGGTWFLSGFWVHPQAQGYGIGGNLLGRALDYGRGRYECYFVYASDDARALTLYQRRGMYASFPIWRMSGDPARLRDYRLPNQLGITVQPISSTASTDMRLRAAIDHLDRQVRGAARPQDHAFWLGFVASGSFSGQLYWREGELIGYSYLTNWAVLGPVVSARIEDQAPILAHSISRAAGRGFNSVFLDVPSLNLAAIRLLLEHRFNLSEVHSFLLTNQPFGQMDRYLPSGATLF